MWGLNIIKNLLRFKKYIQKKSNIIDGSHLI